MSRSLLLQLALVVAFTLPSFADDSAKPFAPRFFAFHNGVSFGSFDKDARTLKELGYHGVNQVYDKGSASLSQRIAAYDKVGVKVLSVYLNVADKPIAADVMKPLADRNALIELTVRKATSATVEAVRQTAATAAGMGIKVALYPHHGFSVATMPQAMDLIAKVDHPNLGVMFNLCHYLKNENPDDLEKSLETAGSRLFAVSTCGADINGKSWGDLIKPLDQGNFPQKRLFATLKKLGFNGPIGLQCYGVKGDKRTNLKNSIAAFKKVLKGL